MSAHWHPPREKRGTLERYHRSYNQECLQIHRPTTLQEVREVTEQFIEHYNYQRPLKAPIVPGPASTCGLSNLAAPCPLCPIRSILIGFLESIHGLAFARRIGSDGCVEVDEEPYYIKQALAGHQVVLLVNAPEKCFEVYHQDTLIKQIPDLWAACRSALL